MVRKKISLPDVIVTHMHKRFTGISATVMALLPVHRRFMDVGLFDRGNLCLGGEIRFYDLLLGWRSPKNGQFRIWHARRANEALLGIFLRSILRQKWKIVFTFPGYKRVNLVLDTLISWCDVVIPTSQNSAKWLKWYTEIIPHGVNLDIFTPTEEGVDILENTSFEGKTIIATFGRIRPNKGTDLFVKAMIEILPRYPNHVAIMVGFCKWNHVSFEKELKEQIKNAGLENRILFLGYVSQEMKYLWFKSVHLCVAASRQEGFGLTSLEAFASGSAVVASMEGVWPLVIDNEVGRLFKTGDVQSLITAIESVLIDPKQLSEMGKKARLRAIECHSVEQEAKALHRIYQRLSVGDVFPCHKGR